MEDSLLKSNFIGRDGFRWWIGQIPPIDAWEDQATGGGWGNRYKVRIMGYHPYSTAELPDDDLPWAGVLLPPGTGTGSANVSKTVKFNPGDVVVGFFLDGDDGQVPMIMGSFGNSVYAAKNGEQIPFGSFTGRTKYMPKAATSVLRATETNDANVKSQQSPQNLSPADAQSKANNANYSAASGAVIPLPTGTADSKNESPTQKALKKIRTAIEGFVSFLRNIRVAFNESINYAREWIKREIDIRAEQITEQVSGMVGGMVNSLMEKLIPVLQQGLQMLYADVFAKILAATGNPAAAHLAGVAAQTSMVPAVKKIQDIITCVVNQVVGKMTGFVADILKSVADNVLNFVQCVGDQVIGSLFNGIIGLIVDGLAGVLDGVSKILQFIENFSVEDLLRNGIDALLGLVGLKSCNKKNKKDKYGAEKYKIGYGPVYQSEPDLSSIVDNANVANAISLGAQVAGVPLDAASDLMGAYGLFSGAIANPQLLDNPSPIDGCYAGLPTVCGAPTINIFGGGGEGATAVPLMGLITGQDTFKTGSIIGVQITNPGSGYTFPPFVEIVDNCNQGYGAIARATINNGQVNSIYVVSEGENYPVEEETSYTVNNVIIVDPGSGYSDGDTVTDDQGNEYETQIFAGSIVKVTPINIKDITDIPTLIVKSDTGSGAILAANLGIRPDFKGEVEKIIDCVT